MIKTTQFEPTRSNTKEYIFLTNGCGFFFPQRFITCFLGKPSQWHRFHWKHANKQSSIWFVWVFIFNSITLRRSYSLRLSYVRCDLFWSSLSSLLYRDTFFLRIFVYTIYKYSKLSNEFRIKIIGASVSYASVHKSGNCSTQIKKKKKNGWT